MSSQEQEQQREGYRVGLVVNNLLAIISLCYPIACFLREGMEADFARVSGCLYAWHLCVYAVLLLTASRAAPEKALETTKSLIFLAAVNGWLGVVWCLMTTALIRERTDPLAIQLLGYNAYVLLVILFNQILLWRLSYLTTDDKKKKAA